MHILTYVLLPGRPSHLPCAHVLQGLEFDDVFLVRLR